MLAVGAIMMMAGLSAHAARIDSVSPQGEVAKVQQVLLRFSEGVVPLGDPTLPPPARVDCQGAVPKGNGRWIDGKTWAFDYASPLPPGTSCVVRALPGWKPTAGGDATLEGSTEFRFSTGGPAVDRIEPSSDSTIAEDQHFLLKLTGPAEPATVLAHAWCEVQGLGDRIPVKIIEGATRDAVLKARGVSKDAASRLLLTCQRPLPAEASVRLVWGRGIAAVANPKVITSAARHFPFTVRQRFTAEFSCERERADVPCMPLRAMTLRFSAPVSRPLAEGVRLQAAAKPGGAAPKALAPFFDKDDTAAMVQEVAFPAPLPENTRFTLTVPPDLRDDAGRMLDNRASYPLAVATAGMPPLARFAASPFGVVEAGPDAALPVTLRHVQADLRGGQPGARVGGKVIDKLIASDDDAELMRWLGRIREDVNNEWQTRDKPLLARESGVRELKLPAPPPGDIATDARSEVIGLPMPERGLHVLEIESTWLGNALLKPKGPMYVRTTVLVTGLGVHVKLGRESSLVWVTTLERAKPVAGARVRISDCQGKVLWNGSTDAQGMARVTQALAMPTEDCLAEPGIFVSARAVDAKGEKDLAFVFSSWDRGIESWRFNLPSWAPDEAQRRAHTVFDRSLLRAGETVSMKHFFRSETGAGLAFAPREAWPTEMRITHTGSGQAFKQPITWLPNGRSAPATWNIPPAAKLGNYEVTLHANEQQWTSGSFRVEEFRLPLVDARLAGPKGVIVAPTELPLSAQLTHLSGGAMAKAPAQVSALLRDRSADWDAYADYAFTPPRDRQAEAAETGDDDDSRPDGARIVADKIALVTDAQGAANLTIKNLPALKGPAELQAELTFADPNGEVQTVSQRLALWPAAVVAGVRAKSWVSARGRVAVQAVVLDTSGQPMIGRAVSVAGRLVRTISSRQRLVGGFYGYDNRHEVKDLGLLCEGRTDSRGLLLCEASLQQAGEVELIARAKDDAGHLSEAATSVWITHQGELWFAQDNDDRIDLLPEKRELNPGDTARLQVRMPFREATALVTVEREGVIDARVVTLRGDEPVIEVPIPAAREGASWAPNVYVTALVLRGRLRDVPWYSFFSWGWRSPLDWWQAWRHESKEYVAPTAMVDLGKPAFKLGVAALRVGLAAHRLDVSVRTDQPQYAVRQTARATVKVSFQGRPLAGAEVAFAAVDEALLALKPNESWLLLDSMMQTRPWLVSTATAHSEIIGRRHYGRKAVPAGGGGGRNPTRELFDTLLLWKGVVRLDAQGEARIDVPLNDSLTSFKLVAIADAGADRFGTGSTSVRVTQDLQMLAGLPPIAREGDRFAAVFTLRNTTTRSMTVQATLKATVNTEASTAAGAGLVRSTMDLPPRTITLAAGAASEVQWPVAVPAGSVSLGWEASVEETGTAKDRASDRMKTTQLVLPAVPVRVMQASLRAVEGPLSIPVVAPADALGGADGVRSGGVRVGLQASLTGALPGLRRYFETYPFVCLEQKVSVAIGLHDAARWAKVVGEMPTYLDKDGLASYYPPRAGDADRGSDRLTAYLLAVSHEAGFVLPPATKDLMLGGLTAFVDGRIKREFWAPRADGDARRLAAIDALARHGRAEARMLGTVQIRPNDWPTASLLDWLSILKHLTTVPQREQRIDEAQQILRARLTWGGTTLKFSTEDSDFWWWLMESPDGNAARLILTVLDDPRWKEELPELVNGALNRQRGGAWLTTTANLWGAIALDKFGAAFEAVPVSGRTVAELGAGRFAHDWPARPAADGAAAALLPWPNPPARLKVDHQGVGRPWLTVQSLAAVPLKAPLSAGYRISRSVLPVQQKVAGQWSKGDVMRVRVEVDAQADMSWVVVADPVPAGATVLGSGLGRDSAIATAMPTATPTSNENTPGRGWLAFEERRFDVFRATYEYLPRGRQVIEYTLRLNTPGVFALPPSRVEAMYAPESFGETPNAPLEIKP